MTNEEPHGGPAGAEYGDQGGYGETGGYHPEAPGHAEPPGYQHPQVYPDYQDFGQQAGYAEYVDQQAYGGNGDQATHPNYDQYVGDLSGGYPPPGGYGQQQSYPAPPAPVPYGYGMPPAPEGWGDYDAEATGFVQLPEPGAPGSPEPSVPFTGESPLAAPGDAQGGYTPPPVDGPITPMTPAATTDPAATGQWTMPFATGPHGQPAQHGQHGQSGQPQPGWGLFPEAPVAGPTEQDGGGAAAAMGQGAAAALAGFQEGRNHSYEVRGQRAPLGDDAVANGLGGTAPAGDTAEDGTPGGVPDPAGWQSVAMAQDAMGGRVAAEQEASLADALARRQVPFHAPSPPADDDPLTGVLPHRTEETDVRGGVATPWPTDDLGDGGAYPEDQLPLDRVTPTPPGDAPETEQFVPPALRAYDAGLATTGAGTAEPVPAGGRPAEPAPAESAVPESFGGVLPSRAAAEQGGGPALADELARGAVYSQPTSGRDSDSSGSGSGLPTEQPAGVDTPMETTQQLPTASVEEAEEAREPLEAREARDFDQPTSQLDMPPTPDGDPDPSTTFGTPESGPTPSAPAAAPDTATATATATHSEHPHTSYVLRVNGVDRPVTGAWIGESLLYVLRERLGLAGAKDGCAQGECGACSVQVDGRLVAACLVPAATTAGSEVRTVEGLAVDGTPSDVQQALSDCGAVQCGFCIPGFAMAVHDLLEGNHEPTELETKRALCGNLCRCSGYRGMLDVVRTVTEQRATRFATLEESEEQEPTETGGNGRIPRQAPGGDA